MKQRLLQREWHWGTWFMVHVCFLNCQHSKILARASSCCPGKRVTHVAEITRTHQEQDSWVGPIFMARGRLADGRHSQSALSKCCCSLAISQPCVPDVFAALQHHMWWFHYSSRQSLVLVSFSADCTPEIFVQDDFASDTKVTGQQSYWKVLSGTDDKWKASRLLLFFILVTLLALFNLLRIQMNIHTSNLFSISWPFSVYFVKHILNIQLNFLAQASLFWQLALY